MNELAWLALWAALFVTQHLGVPSSGLRPRLVSTVGEKGYLGLYSVVSIVVLVLLIRAYVAATPTGVLWPTYELLRWVPLVLMPVALWLVIGGLLAANPTMVGVVLDDSQEVPVHGVLRITRHPVQCGILLWSLSHLAANGDLPSLLLFGSLALVSGWGMVLIDRRRKGALGESWAAFQSATSLLPFVAILSGHQSFNAREIGWLAPALAAVAFVALWWGHVWIAGTPVGVGW
ncbi:MAG: NnrU protein [Gammaproteobacteria bacterium]|nr:NnrU protein [Gammaproteobacteria bacterium]